MRTLAAHHFVVAWGFVLGSLAVATNARAALTPENLRCEYRSSPLGIDTPQPRFSWVLKSTQRQEAQRHYQVLVATTIDKLLQGRADLWDSGRVESAATLGVSYAGKPLGSGQRAYWKVRVWNRDGQMSESNWPEWFELGLLHPADWQAAWIQSPAPAPQSEAELFGDQPAPLLRAEFAITKTIARARAYVSGLGYYELHLNGRKVGDQQLDPGWTSYDRRVLYSTFDVTAELRSGRNAVGIMLGNGWFNPLPLRMWGRFNLREALTVGAPRALAQLVIEFTDGTRQVVATGENWKCGEGPILRNSVYLGELYDARREQAGWDQAGFNDAAWSAARPAGDPRLGVLRAQSAPPIRITRTLKPVRVTEPKPGVFIFDFGQNFAGWSRLHVRGPGGTRVRLRSGELLNADGTLNGLTAVCGQTKAGGANYHYNGVGQPKTAFQIDEYVLKGQGAETYTPRFTFHGFRYVEVTGYPGTPGLEALEGLRLNADVTPVGSFQCSNPRFNRIQEMVLWTELSNLFSVQSDCPHREKFGYGGDIVASSEMGMLNFDMSRFYAKAAQDLADAARPNGGFTETAPFVGISDEGLGGQAGPIGWGTAEPVLLWQLRQYYGEQRLAAEQYDLTKRWIGLLQSCAKDGILDNGISDHESLAPKPRALTGTAFYYYNVQLFAKLAQALGHPEDAAMAARLAGQIKAAFNQKFLPAGSARYDSGSQACQAFALYHDLVPAEAKPFAVEALAHDLAWHEGHLTTGIFGTKFLLDALSEAGHADLAYGVVNQRTFPGWGYMLEQGATTLWEHWEYSDNTYSHNHPMFGSVSEWFYKWLAGIQPAPDAVGFDRILIKPQPVGDLTWVKGSYDSVRGRITSEWEIQQGEFRLHVSIPVGTTATVFMPATDPDQVFEGDQPARAARDLKFLRMTGGAAVFEVGSGDYRFTSR